MIRRAPSVLHSLGPKVGGYEGAAIQTTKAALSLFPRRGDRSQGLKRKQDWLGPRCSSLKYDNNLWWPERKAGVLRCLQPRLKVPAQGPRMTRWPRPWSIMTGAFLLAAETSGRGIQDSPARPTGHVCPCLLLCSSSRPRKFVRARLRRGNCGCSALGTASLRP